MDDDHDFVLIPFEKPFERPAFRRRPIQPRHKLSKHINRNPLVDQYRSKVNKDNTDQEGKALAWSQENSQKLDGQSENLSPVADSIQSTRDARPTSLEGTVDMETRNHCPGLNMTHGFLRNIRHRIKQNSSIVLGKDTTDTRVVIPKPHAHSRSLDPGTSVPVEKLRLSSFKSTEQETAMTVLSTEAEVMKIFPGEIPKPGTAPCKDGPPEFPTIRKTCLAPMSEGVDGTFKRNDQLRKSEATDQIVFSAKKSTITSGSKNTEDQPRRRRPAMQLYQPPQRRAAGRQNSTTTPPCSSQHLLEEEARAEAATLRCDSMRALDPEIQSTGMAVRRTTAITKLKRTVDIGKEIEHRKAANHSCVRQKSEKVGPTVSNPSCLPAAGNVEHQKFDPKAIDELIAAAKAASIQDDITASSMPMDYVQKNGKFDFLNQVFSIDATFDEIDIKGYPEWAHRYLFEAFHCPTLVEADLRTELGRLVAERAWIEPELPFYHQVAARLIQRIAKKEYDSEEDQTSAILSLPFQCGALDACYKAYKRRGRFESQPRERWLTYAVFCSDLLRRLHFGEAPPAVLCQHVLNVLELECTPTLLQCPSEVETSVEMLARCGSQLEEWNRPQLTKVFDKLISGAQTSHPTISMNIELIKEMRQNEWYLGQSRRNQYTSSA